MIDMPLFFSNASVGRVSAKFVLILTACVLLFMLLEPPKSGHGVDERSSNPNAFAKVRGQSCASMPAISVAIATYNRARFLKESLQVYSREPLIGEIVIADDAGSGDFVELSAWLRDAAHNMTEHEVAKILIFPAQRKHGALKNKARAVALASYRWVALMDSDNLAHGDYWQSLLHEWRADPAACASGRFIYAPVVCTGTAFDFTQARIVLGDVTAATWNQHLAFKMGDALLNTGNYVVPRSIVQVWLPLADLDQTAYGMDTMVMNHAAVRQGYSLRFVEGMAYDHRLTTDSLWATTADESMAYLRDHRQELQIAPSKNA